MDSEWYHAKNWYKYQHYQYGCPRWIKMYKSFFDDREVLSLSDREQLLWIRLLLLASEFEGRLPIDARYIAERLGVYHVQSISNLLEKLKSKVLISKEDIRGDREQSSTETVLQSKSKSKNTHTPVVNPSFPVTEKVFRKPFEKPTLNQVVLYMQEIEVPNASFEAEGFLAYYESNGWRVGKNPMKIWKGAVQTWKHNLGRFGGNVNGQERKSEPWQPPDAEQCESHATFLRSIGPKATPDQQRWLKNWEAEHRI